MTLPNHAVASSDRAQPGLSLDRWLARLVVVDAEKLAYSVIFLLAILTRFIDLGARVMSHDESLHTRYSWNLYVGNGFQHTPLMHGPLLFHMTALSYLLFGDNDFTSRIYPALVGIILVMLPLFMRKWLGRTGALAASVFFLFSPLILYYSRYIRHDIPAILFALIIAISIWKYLEERRHVALVWIAGAQAGLFASKEVSFIYIAIFGSFLTLYFVIRLLEVGWSSRRLYLLFALSLILIIAALGVLGISALLPQAPAPTGGNGETLPLGLGDPAPPPLPTGGSIVATIAGVVLGAGIIAMVLAVLIGQWRNLRRFPELDIMIVLGSLVLPALTPFVMHFARELAVQIQPRFEVVPGIVTELIRVNPMDESPDGITRSAYFLVPMVLFSILVGAVWGLKRPQSQMVPKALDDSEYLAHDGGDPDGFIGPEMVERPPDIVDWTQALLSSRWWVIGGLYWALFLFLFTTMFTNGNGLGTGIIGSLGYWLEQQEVKRGNQPWYYYLLIMVPVYEYLPALLTICAGAVGLVSVVNRLRAGLQRDLPPSDEAGEATATPPADDDQIRDRGEEAIAPPHVRPPLDLDAPISFPVLLFIGYWTVINLIAYSMAGEKMPWLTTHLTTPMILLSGWFVGRVLERIDWQSLWQSRTWLLFIVIPILVIALLRSFGPVCVRTPYSILCNTLVPARYARAIFNGQTLDQLTDTYGWMAGAGVFLIVAVVALRITRLSRAGQILRILGLCIVGWLFFLTVRTSVRAAFETYDYATEYLVYAHSAGSVKEVMDQIEEISLKTTDGYGLRVAYDNRVSWPFSWYLRDYYNAVYYADQPSRGLIGDAPVILAGPDNWPKVESLIGDRYYTFEYIRMWWPMQDYFDLSRYDSLRHDPDLQRGIWEIWFNRNYTKYGQATGGNYELSQWPVAERMRLYIRKDVFAQVWDYGVAASEVVRSIDPYSVNQRTLAPDVTFGGGILNRPHGIALAPDGRIYVADSNNHRIVIFDQNGVLVGEFGTQGFAPSPAVLNEPWDVAVAPEGDVFVADTWNHRIMKYSADGEYLTNWGYEGPNLFTEPLAFWGPRGIAIDEQGNIYLADTGNKRIQVFDPRGFFGGQIGTGGTQVGQLDEPVGLAFGPDGNLYVADTWNQRVQVFSREGLFVTAWDFDGWYVQTNERPYLAVDDRGYVYVTDPEAFRIVVFTSDGQYVYSFGDYNIINLVGGVAVDDAGNLYVVDTGAGTVQRYSVGQTP